MPFKLGGYEGGFVEVLAFGFIFVYPKVGKHCCYVGGHESGEYGVSGVLCGRGEDGGVQIFVDGEKVAQNGAQCAPLVKAEVVDEDEEDFVSVVKFGKYFALEYVGA